MLPNLFKCIKGCTDINKKYRQCTLESYVSTIIGQKFMKTYKKEDKKEMESEQ